MNRKIFCLVLAIFSYGFLFTQNVTAAGMFAIMGGTSDGYSGSLRNIQEFKERFNEIMDDSEFMETTGEVARLIVGSYPGSQNTLQMYKNRLTEIMNDSEFMEMAVLVIGNYAGSQNSLQVFKNRFTEIINDSEFMEMAGDAAIIFI